VVGAKYNAVCAQGALLGDIPLLDSPMLVNTRPIVECCALAACLEENAYRQDMAMQIGDSYVLSLEALNQELRTRSVSEQHEHAPS
jgi:hypothetical protein